MINLLKRGGGTAPALRYKCPGNRLNHPWGFFIYLPPEVKQVHLTGAQIDQNGTLAFGDLTSLAFNEKAKIGRGPIVARATP